MTFSRILVINPGSTSTKIAVYEGNTCVMLKTLQHSLSELSRFDRVTDQFDFRKQAILNELAHEGVGIDSFQAIIGRGGLTYPLASGVYRINELMVEHCRIGVMGMHASNLGALISFELTKDLPNTLALIADPVVTDEMEEIARVSGHPHFKRISIFHALNQKAVARQHASKLGKKYEELNLIVAHLGGGITVGAHHLGRVVDVNNGLDGEGPFSPERSGTLPAGALVDLCFSGNYTQEQIRSMIHGKGGLVAYLKSNDVAELEQEVLKGNSNAERILDAMIYQVAKSIGEMATVLKGEVHGILITGGIAYDKRLMAQLRDRISFIAPVWIYPGQDELQALAMNANRVLNGEVEPLEYTKTGF